MFSMLWPILLVIGSNVLYNICTKSTPTGFNVFASLAITYGVATGITLLLYFLTSEEKNLVQEFSRANWACFALSFAIVFLEVGYIFVYRAGWKISTASLVANIGLAVVLLFVGVLLYKEVITLRQVIGALICGAGLILVAK